MLSVAQSRDIYIDEKPARYDHGLRMNTLCLRCRTFSWQELNEAHKRAWNYRRRVLESLRPASRRALSSRATLVRESSAAY